MFKPTVHRRNRSPIRLAPALFPAIIIAAIIASPTTDARVVLVSSSSPARPHSTADHAEPAMRQEHSTGSVASASPSILFAPLPDSLDAFRVHHQTFHFRIGDHALLWFQIRWRTASGLDLLVNEGYFDADDSITLSYKIPTAREESCQFWAYLSTDRTWQTQVWYGETPRAPIRSRLLDFSWSITPTTTSADVGDSLAVRAAVTWDSDSGEIFPYLFCDLLTSTGRIYARAMGYDVKSGVASFLFPFRITPRAAGQPLRIRCYLTDGFDPDGPLLSERFGSDILISPRAPDSSRQRLKLAEGNWYLDRKPIFLIGANQISNWVRWDSVTIVRQVASMAEHGLNYIRLWWDWSTYEPSPGVFSATVKRSLGIILREMERRGIFVELVPVGNWGGWNFTLYKDHWWSDSTNRAAQYRYFGDVARTILDIGVRNIAYISVMQEGSFSFDWFDPKLEVIGWRTYPGAGSLAGAEADWRSWLRANGRPDTWTYDSSMVEWGRWCSERFNDLIALRIKAVRDVAGDEFRFGLEGAQGGFEYDRRIPGWEPTYYLKPERWCHLVDVAEIHTYVPNGLLGYWSYERGVATYVDLMRRFGVTTNVGEYGYTWSATGGNRANNDSMPWAWEQLKAKAEYLRDRGAAGCAYWCWADYDTRPFGLNDTLLRPRVILDSLSGWLDTWLPAYGLDRTALALWRDGARAVTPRAEPHGVLAATSRDQYDSDGERYRSLRIPVLLTHCRDDITDIAFTVDFDSSHIQFVDVASLSGEFPGEPPGTAQPGFSLEFSSGPIAPPIAGPPAVTTSVRIRSRSSRPLDFPVSSSPGCLLDTLPLFYLQFNVLQRGALRPVIALRVDSSQGLVVRDRRLLPVLSGSDSVLLDESVHLRADGRGRVAIRVYQRPALTLLPDSAVSFQAGQFVLRDTVVLDPRDSLVTIRRLALRDTVRHSLAPGVTAATDRAWVRARLVNPSPWLPSWIGEFPNDKSFAVDFDAPAARAAGDTLPASAQITFDALELSDPVRLLIPIRWESGVGGLEAERDTSHAEVLLSPNPARPGDVIEIKTAYGFGPIRSVRIFDYRGAEISTSTDVLRAAGTPGVYFVKVLGSRGIGMGRLVVVE